jgi:hypothetical protein
MKNKFLMIVFLSMFCIATPAYAIVDVVATVQSVLEKVKEVKTKVETVKKKIEDVYRRAAEGFQAASSCFANPKDCGMKALSSLGNNIKRGGSMKGLRVLEGAKGLNSGNLAEKASEGLDGEVIQAYSYVRGQNFGIDKAGSKRDEIQGAVADELAILFAKGMVVRQMIQNETEEELYQSNIKENQSEILAAQNNGAIVSQARLSRILELRSYMQGAKATSELGRYTISTDEEN